MNFQRRSSDRITLPAIVQTVLGMAIMGTGVFLKHIDPNASGMTVDILLVSGGLLIPGNHLVGAIKAWRKP